MQDRSAVPCRALTYLCSTSCCQAAGEAKKQNLQAPHGECLPLGALLSISPLFMELEPRSCACMPCTQIHRCGMIHFSQVRLAPCILRGAQCAPVWVTAYLGAEAGGMDSVGEGHPRAKPGWVLGVLHSVLLMLSF